MSYINIIVLVGVISGIGLFAYHIARMSKEIDKIIKTREEKMEEKNVRKPD